jgi:hypothetical protein
MSAFERYGKAPKSSFAAVNPQQLPTQFSQPHKKQICASITTWTFSLALKDDM